MLRTFINCPHCDNEVTVYHLSWSAIICLHCKEQIDRPIIIDAFSDEPLTEATDILCLKKLSLPSDNSYQLHTANHNHPEWGFGSSMFALIADQKNVYTWYPVEVQTND